LAFGTGFAPAFAGFPCATGAATTFPGIFAFVSGFFDSGIFISGFFPSTLLGSGGLGRGAGFVLAVAGRAALGAWAGTFAVDFLRSSAGRTAFSRRAGAGDRGGAAIFFRVSDLAMRYLP
jgi:hypothetical protein